MPQVLKIDFKSKEAAVKAMEIKIYAGDELRNHGAPCSLTVENGKMINHLFWDSMRSVTESLNSTPDTYPLRLPEVRQDEGATVSFNQSTRHVLAGGDNATIDCIRRPDVAMVAVKALREMRALKLISDDDYKSGLAKIEDYGLPAQESAFRDHRSFAAGTERTPTALKV